MDVQSALFAEIVADPADDMPWLVLADWFDDLGETYRAELVRLSVVLRHDADGPGRVASERRLHELYALGLTIPLPTRRIAVGAHSAMELVFIPPGRFLMGSTPASDGTGEGPVHPVRLTRGFWLGTHPITQGHWRSLLGTQPPGGFRSTLMPVAGVSWMECREFLEALATRHGREFRLPREAEWEYACRALTTTPFSFGRSLSSRQANFDHEANFDGSFPYGWDPTNLARGEPSPIGSYPPNGFGLCDMHGNVWEWCDDWFNPDYYTRSPLIDPPGPTSGTLRALRGGSWHSFDWSCRSASREQFAPESSMSTYGFRVAMPEPNQSPSP